MDVIFNCPKCDQELAVDSSGAGTEINCPSCNAPIVIPEANSPAMRAAAPEAPAAPHHAGPGQPVNAMSSSAAAKVELHLRVPTNKATESLISKPLPPLNATPKDEERKMRVKTIRHTDCIEVGHDKFDEVVTGFLNKIGEANVVSLNTLTYTHVDIGTQKLLTDFAVMIVYRG